MKSIQEETRFGVSLISAGRFSETPLLDTLVILGHVLDLSKEQLLTHPEWRLSSRQQETCEALMQKRARGTPIAYLLGFKEFYGRRFSVTPDVLIPRPDTETLVERVLELITLKNQKSAGPESQSNGGNRSSIKQLSVLDLCTGTGCIGLTIALEQPGTAVTCSDISEEAAAICRKNAEQLKAPSVSVVRSDLFAQISNGSFDIIISNPPYLTEAELEEPVLKAAGEPVSALYGGKDGLYLIDRIIAKGFTFLHTEGYLCVECGMQQAEAISDRFEQAGFTDITVIQDLGGRNRGVCGKRP